MAIYNGKEVKTSETWKWADAKVGDYADAEFVMDMLECVPPASMRKNCAQCGEPQRRRVNPDTGKSQNTYDTFKCIEGNLSSGVWEYCGDCFKGENTMRGDNVPMVALTQGKD